MYASIGKLVVRAAIFYVRHAYRRQLRIGAGLAVLGVGVAAYLAGRNVPEG
jgi:hypothetical protein